MLFCPSFKRSARFFQADQCVTRLRCVEHATCCRGIPNFMRMSTGNVFMNLMESDAVFWWATIFRTSLSMFDKIPHLSWTQCASMSSLRSHNFREAVNNLLTVTMHFQDALSKFHCPSLHKKDLRVHVTSASTCAFALHEPKRCCAVRAQDNCSKRAIAHLAPWVPRCDTLASSTNQCHQLGFTRAQSKYVLLLGGYVHKIPSVFNGTLDPNSDSRVAATILDISSPISISHHQDRTLRCARNSRNYQITAHNYFARRILNQISQQDLDVDFISSGSCADVSG